MPGATVDTEAFVLEKRPPSNSFEGLVLFDVAHGVFTAFHRVSKKAGAQQVALDLFDRCAFVLEKAPQSDAFFVKEARLLERHTGIGASYENLLYASRLARVVAKNPPPEESRSAIGQRFGQALNAFATSGKPEVVYFKSLYALVRDEGHPLKQQWVPSLPPADRELVAQVLKLPVAELATEASSVARLIKRLEEFVAGNTEIGF